MEFLSVLILAIIVGIIIYCVKKNKDEKKIAEEEEKEKQILLEEKKQKELEEFEVIFRQKKEEYLTKGLPVENDETIKLTKGEMCHFICDASFCKITQHTIGYEGGSRGISFRVMKGVSFRIGNYQGHAIKKDIVEKTTGVVYLTSKKIVFSALKNSCVIKYKDIIKLNALESMLQIQTDDRTYLFEVNDFLNFLVILDCLNTNFQNENV